MKSFVLLLPMLLAGLIPALADNTASDSSSSPDGVAASGAVIDPDKDAEIHKMIEASGGSKSMKIAVDRMIEAYKAQYTYLPAEFWTRFSSEMNMDDYINRLIPIYAKYYTLDDLKAINAFYASPAGRHMSLVQGQLATESMQVGQLWGQMLTARVMNEIRKEQMKKATQESPSAGR